MYATRPDDHTAALPVHDVALDVLRRRRCSPVRVVVVHAPRRRRRSGCPAATPGRYPARSTASHDASSSNRCCGSIASASRGDDPEEPRVELIGVVQEAALARVRLVPGWSGSGSKRPSRSQPRSVGNSAIASAPSATSSPQILRGCARRPGTGRPSPRSRSAHRSADRHHRRARAHRRPRPTSTGCTGNSASAMRCRIVEHHRRGQPQPRRRRQPVTQLHRRQRVKTQLLERQPPTAPHPTNQTPTPPPHNPAPPPPTTSNRPPSSSPTKRPANPPADSPPTATRRRTRPTTNPRNTAGTPPPPPPPHQGPPPPPTDPEDGTRHPAGRVRARTTTRRIPRIRARSTSAHVPGHGRWPAPTAPMPPTARAARGPAAGGQRIARRRSPPRIGLPGVAHHPGGRGEHHEQAQRQIRRRGMQMRRRRGLGLPHPRHLSGVSEVTTASSSTPAAWMTPVSGCSASIPATSSATASASVTSTGTIRTCAPRSLSRSASSRAPGASGPGGSPAPDARPARCVRGVRRPGRPAGRCRPMIEHRPVRVEHARDPRPYGSPVARRAASAGAPATARPAWPPAARQPDGTRHGVGHTAMGRLGAGIRVEVEQDEPVRVLRLRAPHQAPYGGTGQVRTSSSACATAPRVTTTNRASARRGSASQPCTSSSARSTAVRPSRIRREAIVGGLTHGGRDTPRPRVGAGVPPSIAVPPPASGADRVTGASSRPRTTQSSSSAVTGTAGKGVQSSVNSPPRHARPRPAADRHRPGAS